MFGYELKGGTWGHTAAMFGIAGGAVAVGYFLGSKQTGASASGSVRSTTNSGSGGGSAVYESDRAVHEYLQFHYAKSSEFMEFPCGPKDALDFPKRCADLTLKSAKKFGRALDVGCSVGRHSFELATRFNEVVGVDFSHAFVKAADTMKNSAEGIEYVSVQQSDISERRVARVPKGIAKDRCSFKQGDACNLSPSLGKFDAILAANLLCRLPHPQKFLESLPSFLNKDGVVILVSPFSWLHEYTQKNEWVGGFSVAGKPVWGEEELDRRMDAIGFKKVKEEDMPFLIREHRRKFQWGCSNATVWTLKQ